MKQTIHPTPRITVILPEIDEERLRDEHNRLIDDLQAFDKDTSQNNAEYRVLALASIIKGHTRRNRNIIDCKL